MDLSLVEDFFFIFPFLPHFLHKLKDENVRRKMGWKYEEVLEPRPKGVNVLPLVLAGSFPITCQFFDPGLESH